MNYQRQYLQLSISFYQEIEHFQYPQDLSSLKLIVTTLFLLPDITTILTPKYYDLKCKP